ncbi:MAG: hypothetical protein AAF727_01610 [Pseudomonadota bacterium]
MARCAVRWDPPENCRFCIRRTRKSSRLHMLPRMPTILHSNAVSRRVFPKRFTETIGYAQGRTLPKKLENVIYGDKRDKDYKNFNIGHVLKAISYDVTELGQTGVEGISIKPDWKSFIASYKTKKTPKSPYLRAGVIGNDLVLQLRDASDKKFEAAALLIKNYTGLKAKLASNTAKVKDVDLESDERLAKAKPNLEARYDAKGNDDKGYGEITGNLILLAHGTPDKLPNGRIVGKELGKRSPEDIVNLLTASKDTKRRISMDYNGQLTLAGCFSASGGPEANKQDDAFALKVLRLFRAKGYNKISVVGYPGQTVIEGKSSTGDDGQAFARGDGAVRVGTPTQADNDQMDKLETDYNAAKKRFAKVEKMLDQRHNVVVKLRAAKKAAKTEADKADMQARLEKAKRLLDAASEASVETKDALLVAAEAFGGSALVKRVHGVIGKFGLREVN